MKYDVVIIGAGPAGIFTAIELIRKGIKYNVHEHCLLVDNGVCGELIILLLGGSMLFLFAKPSINQGFKRILEHKMGSF